MKTMFTMILFLPVILSAGEQRVTLHNLAGTEWEWHSKCAECWPEFKFTFMPDGTLSLNKTSTSYGFDERVGNFSGSYRVLSDEILLTWKYYSEYDQGKPEIHEKRVKITCRADSVYFDTVIAFDTVTLICINSTVKKGQGRKLGGVDVITEGGVKGVVTKNAKIRSGPDTSSAFINFGVDLGEEGLPYCPSGKELRVLARTKEKVRVEKWENYWYYVELVSAGEFGARYGWIYGEFLKLNTD